MRALCIGAIICVMSSTALADVPVPGVPRPCEGKRNGDACVYYPGGVATQGICQSAGGNSPSCGNIPPGVEPRRGGCAGCGLSPQPSNIGFALALAGLGLLLARRHNS